MLVVYDICGRHNHIQDLWEVHTDGEVVSGGLAGFWMHDSAVCADGIGTCGHFIRDEQYSDGRSFR